MTLEVGTEIYLSPLNIEIMNKVQKSAQLTEQQKFALDGYLINNNRFLCYQLGNGSKAKEESILAMAQRWFNTPLVKQYLEIRKAQIFPEQVDGEAKDYTNKDVLLSELSKMVQRTHNVKEKNEVLKSIASITQMQKLENKDDMKLIHYYVPITCKRCNLYVAELERKQHAK